ncbi:hypothetical protein HPOKI422_03540 [Helicobacter pylori oki422]|nr:hypothetical protein HPOKI422_03540 [Helicobacter pylori oki422]
MLNPFYEEALCLLVLKALVNSTQANFSSILTNSATN